MKIGLHVVSFSWPERSFLDRTDSRFSCHGSRGCRHRRVDPDGPLVPNGSVRPRDRTDA